MTAESITCEKPTKTRAAEGTDTMTSNRADKIEGWGERGEVAVIRACSLYQRSRCLTAPEVRDGRRQGQSLPGFLEEDILLGRMRYSGAPRKHKAPHTISSRREKKQRWGFEEKSTGAIDMFVSSMPKHRQTSPHAPTLPIWPGLDHLSSIHTPPTLIYLYSEHSVTSISHTSSHLHRQTER